MKKPEHNSNFWFGFAMGSLSLTALAYFVATKKGRTSLKKFLEYAENVEDFPEEIMSLLPALQEHLRNEPKHEHHEPDHKEETHTPSQEAKTAHTLENIFEKMRETTQNQKHVKKFFVKGGKIIDSGVK